MNREFILPTSVSQFSDFAIAATDCPLGFFNPVLPDNTHYFVGMVATDSPIYSPSGVEQTYTVQNSNTKEPIDPSTCFLPPIGATTISSTIPPPSLLSEAGIAYIRNSSPLPQYTYNSFLTIYNMIAPPGYLPIGSFAIMQTLNHWLGFYPIIPNSPGFYSPGSVPAGSWDEAFTFLKPASFFAANPNLQCVAQGQCEQIVVNDVIYTSPAAGPFNAPFTAFKLPNSGAVSCVPGNVESALLWDTTK